MSRDDDSGAMLPPMAGLPAPQDSEDDTYSAWAKQEGETEKGYDAFLTYLNMGPADRSIHKAYFVHTGRPVPARKGARLAPGGWVQRAVRFRWADRAREFDEYESKRKFQITQDRREQAYLRWAEELGEYQARLKRIAMGLETCTPQQYAALVQTFEWAGIENPNNNRELTGAQAQQSNVHIYLPDNGRGPKR